MIVLSKWLTKIVAKIELKIIQDENSKIQQIE